MNFTQFRQLIPTLKNAPLGGLKAQFVMAPAERIKFTDQKIKDSKPKKAAVLALFYPDKQNNTRFVLTLRASYNGTHSSQISFPGGKKEFIDENLSATSKRESQEEIGVAISDINMLKELTEAYIPPSNFLVTPFIGVLHEVPKFKANEEVETIIEVLVSDLLNDRNVTIKNMSTSYMKNIDVPCFKLNDYIVWGATAMILNEIKILLKTI
ncbi:MAG: CoA pyrophosphatase [Flavobacteriaceae bacterium]|nr:CoA pyrophosphatase [Flavobacteriaceae bacterium]